MDVDRVTNALRDALTTYAALEPQKAARVVAALFGLASAKRMAPLLDDVARSVTAGVQNVIIRSAREKYARTPIGAMGVFAYNEHDMDELESLQCEFEVLDRLAANGNIDIIERKTESRTGKRLTSLLSFRRLA